MTRKKVPFQEDNGTEGEGQAKDMTAKNVKGQPRTPQVFGGGWPWDLGPVRLGISSCLLGQRVRFDGGHKRDAFLVETFGQFVEWVPVCPEVGVGMGVPRPSVRLQESEGQVRLVDPKSGTDWTQQMLAYAHEKVAALQLVELSGFVLKKDSPSCGMQRVKLYGRGMPRKQGQGLFARVLIQLCPQLPVEEEGRLCDPRLRENFIERVFAYQRLRRLFSSAWSLGDLVAFHTAHKFQLMAHSYRHLQELGRLVAKANDTSRMAVAQDYQSLFMDCLAVLASRGSNTNVLQHIAGFFKKKLPSGDRNELQALIQDYRRGLVPLVVPLTLIRHFVLREGEEYIAGQTYLAPHPKELMLRNHV